MRRILFLLLLSVLAALPGRAQIVNRLKVDDPTFQRYAWGRMQQYNPANLVLADSLYTVGTQQGNYRYRCLALALEFPVRYAQGEYERMDEAVAEIKENIARHPEARDFYYPVVHEYCQYLISLDRASDAMLEARAMDRLASEQERAAGHMYAHRIVGLIQSYRTNSYLAIQNFTRAAQECKEARAEQELPNLLILIAQEYIKLGEFAKAEDYCAQAEQYQEFFPTLRIKTRMTRAYLHNARQDWEAFWRSYDELVGDPLLYEYERKRVHKRGLYRVVGTEEHLAVQGAVPQKVLYMLQAGRIVALHVGGVVADIYDGTSAGRIAPELFDDERDQIQMLLKILPAPEICDSLQHILRCRLLLFQHFIHGILHQFGSDHIQERCRQ